MMRRWFLAVLASWFMVYAPAGLADSSAGEIRFGSVAMDTPAVMHHRLSPLIDYLTKALDRPVTLKLSSNMKEAFTEAADENVELAYLTPVAYLRAHEMGGSQLVVKTVTQGHGSFQLMIVVREDSPIKSVAQLAGKSFAFGDPAALLQRAAVVGAGMPLGKLGKLDFLGHYDNIARAVMRGFYDAGIVKDTTAFKWQGKGLRILYASPQLPPYNITASAKVGPELLAKMRQAFLNLNLANPGHGAVIRALDKNYTGFAPTSDAEYDIVRQLIKPFDKQE
jgi:phosphonate transport system substrate-binding protein